MSTHREEAVLEPQASERLAAPPSNAPTATIESLRARLLSERAASKEAQQQVQQLADKVSELQTRLNLEIEHRKKAEAAMGQVLHVLQSKGLAVECALPSTSSQSESFESDHVSHANSMKGGDSEHSSADKDCHSSEADKHRVVDRSSGYGNDVKQQVFEEDLHRDVQLMELSQLFDSLDEGHTLDDEKSTRIESNVKGTVEGGIDKVEEEYASHDVEYQIVNESPSNIDDVEDFEGHPSKDDKDAITQVTVGGSVPMGPPEAEEGENDVYKGLAGQQDAIGSQGQGCDTNSKQQSWSESTAGLLGDRAKHAEDFGKSWSYEGLSSSIPDHAEELGKSQSVEGMGSSMVKEATCLLTNVQQDCDMITGSTGSSSDSHQDSDLNETLQRLDTGKMMELEHRKMSDPDKDILHGSKQKDIRPDFPLKNGLSYDSGRGTPIRDVSFTRGPVTKAFPTREHFISGASGFGTSAQSPAVSDGLLTLVDYKNGKLGSILMALQLAKQQLSDEEHNIPPYMEEKLDNSVPPPLNGKPYGGYYAERLHHPLSQSWRHGVHNHAAPIINFPMSPTSDQDHTVFHDGLRRTGSGAMNYAGDGYLQPKGELHLGNGITLYTD